MDEIDRQFEFAKLLVARLERLSADSIWAHRSSGLRGSLLRCIEQIEADRGMSGENACVDQAMADRFKRLVEDGFQMLKNAGREVKG